MCSEAATPLPESNTPGAPSPDNSRGSSINPVQSSTNGGCSVARPHRTTALAAATLGLSLAALARIRRHSRRARR